VSAALARLWSRANSQAGIAVPCLVALLWCLCLVLATLGGAHVRAHRVIVGGCRWQNPHASLCVCVWGGIYNCAVIALYVLVKEPAYCVFDDLFVSIKTFVRARVCLFISSVTQEFSCCVGNRLKVKRTPAECFYEGG
jgi:hypothetical protein